MAVNGSAVAADKVTRAIARAVDARTDVEITFCTGDSLATDWTVVEPPVQVCDRQGLAFWGGRASAAFMAEILEGLSDGSITTGVTIDTSLP